MRNIVRAAAVMHDMAHAKKLMIAPTDTIGPTQDRPLRVASTCSGACVPVRRSTLEPTASTSAYVENTKNAPEISAVPMTARGMVLNGSFASAPSAVALSNPTNAKVASTRPAPTGVTANTDRVNCVGSQLNGCARVGITNKSTIVATDAHSIQSMNRVDSSTLR